MLSLLPEKTVEDQWHSLLETWEVTCTKVLGKKKEQQKSQRVDFI